MTNTDRKIKLLSEVEKYISDNEETFCDISDRENYLNFLFNLSQNIDTSINIEMLEDSSDRWGQANVYKNGYTIVLTNDVLSVEIESEEQFVNYILELEEEAKNINISNKKDTGELMECLQYLIDSEEDHFFENCECEIERDYKDDIKKCNCEANKKHIFRSAINTFNLLLKK